MSTETPNAVANKTRSPVTSDEFKTLNYQEQNRSPKALIIGPPKEPPDPVMLQFLSDYKPNRKSTESSAIKKEAEEEEEEKHQDKFLKTRM